MAVPPLLARAIGSGRRRIDRIAELAVAVSAVITVGGIVLIFVFVFKEALPVLVDQATMAEANLRGFFTVGPWQPVSDHPRYSLYPLLVGSLKATVIAVLTAVPIAVLAALYTAEFAPRQVREFLKPVVELLAGIPSVVLGFFALMVLASVLQEVTGSPTRLNALNAGIALGFSIIPVVYSVSEDALRAVPRSYREASLALGASAWQTAFTVTLPAAWAGIFAAVMLGIGRAVGETMIVLMATGNTPVLDWSIFNGMRTLSANIAVEIPEAPHGGTLYRVLFFSAALLFMMTFLVNTIAEVVRQRLRERYRTL